MIGGAQIGTLALGRTVTTKSGSTITVNINGITVTAQCARDLTPSVGDTVVVNKIGSAWYVMQRVYSTAPASVTNPEPPNPKPAQITGTLVMPPVETRSRTNGAWRTDTDDVIQGSSGAYSTHFGCAFYGTQPLALSGTTVLSATALIRREAGGPYLASAATLRLVTETTRPANDPTLTSSTTGPALHVGETTESFTVPASWVQSMAAGTAGGLAVYVSGGSPYLRFAGRGAWSPGWTLVVNWQRG